MSNTQSNHTGVGKETELSVSTVSGTVYVRMTKQDFLRAAEQAGSANEKALKATIKIHLSHECLEAFKGFWKFCQLKHKGCENGYQKTR